MRTVKVRILPPQPKFSPLKLMVSAIAERRHNEDIMSSLTDGTGTLTLATTAPSSVFPDATWPGNFSPVKLLVWFSLVILLARLSFLKGTSGRLRWAGLAAIAIVVAMGAAAGCGGGSSASGSTGNLGTPAGGPTAITVTGTAGSSASAVKQTTTIQLTVQ
jgi:hypothetical protein